MFADDLAEREQTMFGALVFLVDGRVAVAAGAEWRSHEHGDVEDAL
jgi:hypothetical protein